MHSNLSGPTKAVCYREVFAIKGVCYKRFHCAGFVFSGRCSGTYLVSTVEPLCNEPWKQ